MSIQRKTSTVSHLDRELILAHILKKPRTWIIGHPDHRLTPDQQRRLDRNLRQRARGVPVPYLLGTKEFCNYSFVVGPGVLVPRPETEHLVEAALASIPNRPEYTVADVGTGSGCIAITLSLHRPKIRVFALDVSPRALRYARKNIQRLGVHKLVTVLRGNFLKPVIERNIKPDLIVANLPYATPQEYAAVQAEPRIAIVGGNDGLAAYRKFFGQIRNAGWNIPIILEIDPRRYQAVNQLARSTFENITVHAIRDLAGHNRVVTIRPNQNKRRH